MEAAFNMCIMTALIPLMSKIVNSLIDNVSGLVMNFMTKIWTWSLGGMNVVKITSSHGFTKGGSRISTGIHEKQAIDAISYFLCKKEQTSNHANFATCGKTNYVSPSGDVIIDKITISSSEKVVDNGSSIITTNVTILRSKMSMSYILTFINSAISLYELREVPKQGMWITYKADRRTLFDYYPFEDELINKDSLYFPEKDKVFEMVDNLLLGKIKKIGLILHGPGGVGKTSLIKAIAEVTGRHIISVKLSTISSDRSLMQIFYGTSLIVQKHNCNEAEHALSMKERIFVFEDIDTECQEINNRSKEKVTIDTTVSPKSLNDRTLTLGGILNVLDGIIAINGSIVIMTTNHIEQLDPALFRYGRVSMNIHLKEMTAKYALLNIQSKFPDYHGYIPDGLLVPATISAMIVIANSCEELETLLHRAVGAVNDK